MSRPRVIKVGQTRRHINGSLLLVATATEGEAYRLMVLDRPKWVWLGFNDGELFTAQSEWIETWTEELA